jgi:hypothetical protein
MPNPTKIAVNYGENQVLNLNPIDRNGNLTTFRGETDGPILGAARLFVSVKRPSANELYYKIQIRFELPKVEQVDGVHTVTRTNRSTIELSINKSSTSAEIAEYVDLMTSLLGTPDIKAVMEGLEGFF